VIDYKVLLEKYAQHVFECEGSDFIVNINESSRSDVKFLEEEARELKYISEILEQNPY
jgi:hypothetical protein